MKLIKPSWLRHSGENKDFEVYSCHVSPDGKRLATAGGDGHVRVWSTESIYRADDSYTEPRQLCHMSHHLGTIHSVRFSPNGRYLASGADDKLICIYHLDNSAPSNVPSFGTNEPPPVENWKTYKRLVGHDNDVQDLAWSYDNSILVSVGLDSKVVIWSGHTFEKLKTLAVHQSHVKGITFDPANKFFATASDDRTIKIWKFTPPPPNATQHDMVNNFVLETTISSPFKSSPLTTYFRRCSWSPDGNHIAAANAVNGPVSSVAIIERARWDSEINLIGHEGPTEVCIFSPRLFYTKRPPPNGTANGANTPNLVTVIASAGQDKTLSIWNTNTSRPLVILQDMASKSISDLAWTPDGQTLFVASLDGGIVAVKFEVGELGWVATAEENDKALQKYGVSRKGMGIPEDVDGLHLESLSKEGELQGAKERMGALMGDVEGPKKGKKATGTTTTNGSKPAESSTNGETNGTSKPSKEAAQEKQETPEQAAKRREELKARVTITKDGKKRIAPLLVSSSTAGQSSLPQSQLVGAGFTKANRVETPGIVLDMSRPYDGLPRGGLATMLLGNKRKAAAMDGDEDEEASKRAATGPVPIMVDGGESLEPATLTAPVHGVVPTPEFLRPAVINPSMAVSQIRLAVPKVRSHILRPLKGGVLQEETALEEASKVPETIVLEARNPVHAREPSRIMATKRGALLWQDFLPRAIILVTGNKNFWAAACEDGSVYFWTPAGRRLTNPLILESQPVIVESREHWLLCITSVGMCHVFNIKTMSSPHPPVSLGPILDLAITSLSPHSAPNVGPSVTSAHLDSQGHIVVTLSNGDGFYYANNMYCWQRLSESWWAVGSQYWNSNDSSLSALQTTAVGPVSSKKDSEANVSAGIIPYLERHTTTEFLFKGRSYTLQRLHKTLLAKDGFEGFESSVSIAHLENRIAGALALGSKVEFARYLFMYAKRIGAEGLKPKVEELLNSLVGGVLQEGGQGSDAGKGWFGQEATLCGWDRKELLKGVVLTLGKFRDLQRLTVQYARLVDLANSENGAAEGNESTMDLEE
ncbi:protein HIR1 [Rhypophila decipiens]